ncbi:hypothetical protein FisN_9Hh281 [Fistulifera solaris]|uniref:Uncharacterized protein n=1 Tax=Fistulifera solaris TaxID=1519565 RepID=A0A1Z5JB29_FISSO|nr:hypothetical protein FisN_9Hh281 [Fistulifera solaris]|eukprot:GAX11185.1 hypothetical protein FisN_9Hh281 [Fistulifera solaris]
MRRTPLIVLFARTLPCWGFQGITPTTVITGHTPPPKTRVESPPSELSMVDVSFLTDILPDVRLLKYMQLIVADPENTPILLSALSSFLVLAGISFTTPPPVSSSTNSYGYAAVTNNEGSMTTSYQATLTETDVYRQQQRSVRGMSARKSAPAPKLPSMQGEDRYKPLSYGPMSRPGGTSPLKTIVKASTVEQSVVAPPKQQPPKRFTSSPREFNSFDGPSNPGNKKSFDWAPKAAGDNVKVPRVRKPPVMPSRGDKPPASYAPTVASSSVGSYLESLGGTPSNLKPSSYAPGAKGIRQVRNALSNSYLEDMGLGEISNNVKSLRSDVPAKSTSPTAVPGAAQQTGSYLETIGGGSAQTKESSYAPTKASIITKATGNALGSSYFAAMGRSAPTTVYQYSPTELAARAAALQAEDDSISEKPYSPESPGSVKSQGSYLDTVGGPTSARKESSYAPTKPSVMTKPMGNAMGSAYFASMSAAIPPSYSYLLTNDPEPPTAGAMKPYLSSLTKDDPNAKRPSSFAPTKSSVGKMSSTTVGSSYLQMMGSKKSSASAEGRVMANHMPATQRNRDSTATEAGSYLDGLSGGKQSSMSKKPSFAPTQPSASKKSGTTVGSSYLNSLGR